MTQFLHMGGYGFYVWSAYGLVMAVLGVQGLMSLRQWRNYRLRREQDAP